MLWIFFISPAQWIHVWLLDIASDLINVTLVIMVEDCTAEEYDQLWEKLSKMVTNFFLWRSYVLTCIMQSHLRRFTSLAHGEWEVFSFIH